MAFNTKVLVSSVGIARTLYTYISPKGKVYLTLAPWKRREPCAELPYTYLLTA